MYSNIDYDSESKIWSTPKSITIFDKNTSVGHIALFMMRSRSPDMICQISESDNTTLTFHKASDYAVLIAEHLKSLGLTEKDVVGIVAPNTTLLMPTVVGCWLNCTPYHAVNPLLEEDVLSHIYYITKPKLIFCDGNYYEKLKSATKDYETKFYTLCNHLEGISTVEDIFKTSKEQAMYRPVALKYGSNQTMAIYCTSGTTGPPKCVCYSNARILVEINFINISTTIYSTSELYWVTSLLSLIFTTIYGAKSIISTDPPTPEHITEIARKYSITFLLAPPMSMYQLSNLHEFTKANLPSLQCIFMTGSASTTSTLQRLRDKLKGTIILQSYGSTETGSIAYNVSYFEAGVLGKLSSGIELRIVDPATKSSLDYNESGEICVRHKECWPGYIGDDEATTNVLYDDGWIRTGDKGYMDQYNVLHFCDRYKDIMKYNGFQFSPTEIELTIYELPDVVDVCVFGVYDENFGDLAAAAVVKSGDSLTEKDIMDYVADCQKLEYNRLHYGVFFVKKIARNSSGKVLRNKMREICLEQAKNSSKL